jgi:anti-sigma factor RsiW
MICSQRHNINRYHDGELPSAERAAVEMHLAGCEACRRSLDQLRSLSTLISRAERPLVGPTALERWSRHGRTGERAVLRVAGWMTATAAAVMIAALLTWPASRAGEASTAAASLDSTVLAVADASEDAGSDVVLAEWMANDLDGETYAR